MKSHLAEFPLEGELSDEDVRGALSPEEWAQAIKPLAEPGAQGTPDWLMQRCGHVTASRFVDVQDFTQDRVTKGSKPRKDGTQATPGRTIPGEPGAKRQMYLREVVIERITGLPVEHYVSKPMRDGIEREPDAKMAYEAKTGRLLLDYAFKKHPTLQWVGGSPDALIIPGGGAEFKCPLPTTHLDTLLNGMDEEHLPQVQGLMWLFDAQWWDFCSFCPLFDEPLRTYIQRIERDDAFIERLEADVRAFLGEVDAIVKRLRP